MEVLMKMNMEQNILFEKLEEIKKEIEEGICNIYSSSNFHGDFSEIYETFFDDEKKCPHKYFIYDYGTNNGRFCEYSEQGPEKQLMTYSSDGSLCIEDFKNGVAYKEVTYKDGKKNGYYLNAYPNGCLKEEGFYDNDLKCGDYRKYTPKGVLIRQAQYHNGQLNGTCVDYYDNGNLKGISVYKDGLKNGVCSHTDLEGITTTTVYVNGQEKVPLSSAHKTTSKKISNLNDVLLSCSKSDKDNTKHAPQKGIVPPKIVFPSRGGR